MSAGRVVIAGRFPAGQQVHLYRVADEGVSTHVGGELIQTRKADVEGVVSFGGQKVVAGGRFIAFGYVEGRPLSVRCRGMSKGELAEVLGQSPVGPDPVKHADGQVVGGVYRGRPDERPEVEGESAESENVPAGA